MYSTNLALILKSYYLCGPVTCSFFKSLYYVMMASDLAVLVNDIFEIWQLILWKTQWIILLGKLAPFSSRKQHYLLVWFLLIIFIYLHFVLFCFCLDLLFVSWRIHLNWSFSLINFGSVHIELKFDSKFESAILNNINEKMSSLCFNQTHAFHVITTIISPPSSPLGLFCSPETKIVQSVLGKG